jgi:hypothetical protein
MNRHIFSIVAVLFQFANAGVSYYRDSKMAMAWLCSGIMIIFIEILLEFKRINNDKSN